jgi:hypothetical protein
MLKVVGGVVVYAFAIFGFGMYLQRVHAKGME